LARQTGSDRETDRQRDGRMRREEEDSSGLRYNALYIEVSTVDSRDKERHRDMRSVDRVKSNRTPSFESSVRVTNADDNTIEYLRFFFASINASKCLRLISMGIVLYACC